MRLVIDVPEMVYEGIRNRTEGKGIIECNSQAMADAIYHGTPLPSMKDELICKILMEVDGGTDDKYLNYLDVCERIKQSVNEYFEEINNADSN